MAHDTPFALDHFRAYNIDGVLVDHRVELRGQFDKEFRRHRLVELEHFANPVDKNREGIHEKIAHQTWYTLDPETAAEPSRVVRLRNQFGEQRLLLGDAALLITPAEKIEPGSALSPTLGHYKCYRVVKGREIGRTVTLRDQFRRDSVSVLEPLLFAVPVEKRYRELEPIHDEKTHLTIYRLTPVEHATRREVRDQFDHYSLDILSTAMLAVPTDKLEWRLAG
jgi:hypothetical protein